MTELSALLLEESDASAVLIAMSGVLEPARQLARDLHAAGGAGAGGLRRRPRGAATRSARCSYDPKDLAALRVLARAYVMRGTAPRHWRPRAWPRPTIRATAGFELAEILASLGSQEEAHQELERLRAGGAPQAEIDRRLALLAFNSGDYKEARQRFTDLLASGDGNDGVQLYLADIAARDGDAGRGAGRLPTPVRFLASR